MAELDRSFRDLLEAAKKAVGDGNAVGGAQAAKAVSTLVRADRDVAAYEAQQRAAAWENDDEACRAELLRRLTLYAGAARAGASDEELAHIAATGAER